MIVRLSFHFNDASKTGYPRSQKNFFVQKNFYKDLTCTTDFFEGWCWFKFNNLGLLLGMTLKLYSCDAKWLKLKVTKLWTANSYVRKDDKGGNPLSPPTPILNKAKSLKLYYITLETNKVITKRIEFNYCLAFSL